jgi:release factor glutamine methyltransferase
LTGNEVLSAADLLRIATGRLSAAGVDSARPDARILLAQAMGVSREELIVGALRPTPQQAHAFQALVSRRTAREPLAYITGAKEFWSLDFKVGPGVLVPRPETETLIEAALAACPDRQAPLTIADLGTGSGALLLAALAEFPKARGIGFERSPEALAYAQTNLRSHSLGRRGEILAGDWNDAPIQGFDLIFSNPPYIPTAEIAALEPEVRLYEPRAALDGGTDGLDAYRALAGLLPRLLRPGAIALLELGHGQAGRVEPLFRELIVLHVAPDLAGNPRVLVLQAPK